MTDTSLQNAPTQTQSNQIDWTELIKKSTKKALDNALNMQVQNVNNLGLDAMQQGVPPDHVTKEIIKSITGQDLKTYSPNQTPTGGGQASSTSVGGDTSTTTDTSNTSNVRPNAQSPSPTFSTQPASSPMGFGNMTADSQGNMVEQKPGFVAGLLQVLLGRNPNQSALNDLATLSNVKQVQAQSQQVAGTEQIQPKDIASMDVQSYTQSIQATKDSLQGAHQYLTDLLAERAQMLSHPVQMKFNKELRDNATRLDAEIATATKQVDAYTKNMKTLASNRPSVSKSMQKAKQTTDQYNLKTPSGNAYKLLNRS